MKRNLITIVFLFIGATAALSKAMPSDSKDSLEAYYAATEKRLMTRVKSLNPEQLNFKPSADRWSVAQCVDHITKTEAMLLGYVKQLLAQPANPDKKLEVKGNLQDLIKMMEDRSRTAQAPEALSPAESSYQLNTLLDAFKKQRAETLTLIEATSMDDLNNHITQMPTGDYADAYRTLYYIAAHSSRHTYQIEEVMADAAFPK